MRERWLKLEFAGLLAVVLALYFLLFKSAWGWISAGF